MTDNPYDEALWIMEHIDEVHIWEAVYYAVVDHIQHTSNFNNILKELKDD